MFNELHVVFNRLSMENKHKETKVLYIDFTENEHFFVGTTLKSTTRTSFAQDAHECARITTSYWLAAIINSLKTIERTTFCRCDLLYGFFTRNLYIQGV